MSEYTQIFEDSFNRVIGPSLKITSKSSAFFRRFYEHFLENSPAAAEHFKRTDMQKQIGMLQKSFYQLVTFYMLQEPLPGLIAIAKTHSHGGHNIASELYDVWLNALVITVEDMDPEYNPDVGLSWRLALAAGITFMKHYQAEDEED